MTAPNYARRHASCEPTFHPVKRQSNPNRMIQDLGVEMRWGAPGHVARLYRNLRDHAPYTFTFDHVVIHEEDAPEEFDYLPSLARKTPVGMFYPLSAHMLELYRSRQADRDIFSALAEIDMLLPTERQVTAEDVENFCLTRFNGKPLAPAPPVDPPITILATDLEAQGYRGTLHAADNPRCLLEIGWQPKPKSRIYFAGILEYRAAESKIRSRWRLPGPTGINHLLRQKLEQICRNRLEWLSPEARKDYLAGLEGEHSD